MKILWFLIGFFLALLLVLIVNAGAVKKARKKQKRQHQKSKIQATKIIVFSVMVTYYVAFIVGLWVVIAKDVYQLSTLLTFVGSVSVFAVAFYCWKSKAENLEKIRKGNPELSGALSDFSGMSSQ